MGRGAVFSSMQMRGSQHRFHRSLLLSFFFFVISFWQKQARRRESNSGVPLCCCQRTRLQTARMSKFLHLQSSITCGGSAYTHVLTHNTQTHTHARAHTRGNGKSNKKKTIHSRNKGRDVFGALALTHLEVTQSSTCNVHRVNEHHGLRRKSLP